MEFPREEGGYAATVMCEEDHYRDYEERCTYEEQDRMGEGEGTIIEDGRHDYERTVQELYNMKNRTAVQEGDVQVLCRLFLL